MVVPGKIEKGCFIPDEPIATADGTPARLLIDDGIRGGNGSANGAQPWDAERLREWHELARLVQQERDADLELTSEMAAGEEP